MLKGAMATEQRTRPVASEDRERLRDIVKQHGEAQTVTLTGIPRSTIGRVLAELPVRAGTQIALRQALRELDEGAGG